MSDFILATLATFGVSALINGYDGPHGILLKLRNKFKVFECIVCLSVWVAIPILLLIFFGQMLIVWALAVIGVIILIERLT